MGFFLRYALLTAASFFIILSGPGAPSAAQKKAGHLPPVTSVKDVVVRVDGSDITEGMIRGAVNNIMPLKSFHTSVSDRRYKAIRKEALDNIIDNRLIYKEAKKKKQAELSKKEYDKQIKLIEKRLPAGETIKDVLKRSNLTMEGLKEEIRRSFVIGKMRKEKTAAFKKLASDKVSVKYMKDYYKKNLKKFVEPGSVHLRGILIKVEPSASQRLWNEARKKIIKIGKEARSGADFTALVKKYSEGPRAAKGGDMGWAHKGSLLEGIDEAVEKMKPGDISVPVETIYGYHIFKLEGLRPSRQKKFSELDTKRLKSELEKKEFKRLWSKWIKGLRDHADIQYLREF